MCEAEGDAGADDRHPASITGEQGVTKPSERQLLDDRRDDCDHDPVRDVRGDVFRFPGIGGDALLTARVKDRSKEDREHVHAEPDTEPDLHRGAPRRRAA